MEGKALKIKVFPTFYLIDEEGKVIRRMDGFDQGEFLKMLASPDMYRVYKQNLKLIAVSKMVQ